jgi:hypothetical protein
MPAPKRPFRLVVQRTGDTRRTRFRVIAYNGNSTSATAEYGTLFELVGVLDSAVPEVVLDLKTNGSILFSGEIELDDSQLRALRLA